MAKWLTEWLTRRETLRMVNNHPLVEEGQYQLWRVQVQVTVGTMPSLAK